MTLELGFEHRDSPEETWFFYTGLPVVAKVTGWSFIILGILIAALSPRGSAMDRLGALVLMVLVGTFVLRFARSGVHISPDGVRVDQRAWTTKVPWADVHRFEADGRYIVLRRASRKPVRLWDALGLRIPGVSALSLDALDFLLLDLNRSLSHWRPQEAAEGDP
jgi:hypothetical protein